MSKLYATLMSALAERSINAYLQSPDQLVVSTQRGSPLPFAGNSFWVSRKRRRWYLCTWGPVCYEVPPEADLPSLCAEFAGHGCCAQTFVPEDLVQRYGLRQVDCDEFDRLFAESEGPCDPR